MYVCDQKRKSDLKGFIFSIIYKGNSILKCFNVSSALIIFWSKLKIPAPLQSDESAFFFWDETKCYADAVIKNLGTIFKTFKLKRLISFRLAKIINFKTFWKSNM